MHRNDGLTNACENDEIRSRLEMNPLQGGVKKPTSFRLPLDLLADDDERRRCRPEGWGHSLPSTTTLCSNRCVAPPAIAPRAFPNQSNPAEAPVLRAVTVRDAVGNIRRVPDGLPGVGLQAAATPRVRRLRVLR